MHRNHVTAACPAAARPAARPAAARPAAGRVARAARRTGGRPS
ncbi:hypothetical protein [Kitasatospora indigofera]